MTDRPGLGAVLAVAGAAAFAAMSALIKLAGRELPTAEVVFSRNAVALAVLAPWFIGRQRSGALDLRTRRPAMHALRAAAGLGAMYCYFYALTQLPLASAVLLNYSQPLFLPIIAWVWIGERPAARIWPAVALGFVGVILILKPGLGWAGPAGLIGLAAGVLAATAMAAIRRMATTEPALRIVFYFTALGTLVSAIPAVRVWQAPTSAQCAALVGAGVTAASGQIMITRAYTLAPAARIGALVYTSVVFAALLGWLIWDETLDLVSLAGGVLVIAAAVIVVSIRAPRTGPRRV